MTEEHHDRSAASLREACTEAEEFEDEGDEEELDDRGEELDCNNNGLIEDQDAGGEAAEPSTALSDSDNKKGYTRQNHVREAGSVPRRRVKGGEAITDTPPLQLPPPGLKSASRQAGQGENQNNRGREAALTRTSVAPGAYTTRGRAFGLRMPIMRNLSAQCSYFLALFQGGK